MIRYHAVMLDETRCEFGVDIDATDRQTAMEELADQYPESRCIQLEDPHDTEKRVSTMEDLIRRGADFDEDGRPFFPHGDEDDDEDVEDEFDDSDYDGGY